MFVRAARETLIRSDGGKRSRINTYAELSFSFLTLYADAFLRFPPPHFLRFHASKLSTSKQKALSMKYLAIFIHQPMLG